MGSDCRLDHTIMYKLVFERALAVVEVVVFGDDVVVVVFTEHETLQQCG